MTPKLVFIIPYRNRKEHKHFFLKYMDYLLEDWEKNDYQIFFIHQNDQRDFNRGALKNIGLYVIRTLYPNHYKKITIVFNDVDSLPYRKNLLNYETKKGTIKHFFGTKKTLGGIVSINAEDFEKIGGFPNYWSWGFEDNILYNRALKNNIYVDRCQFFPLFDRNILHLTEGVKRNINLNHKNYNYNCDENNNYSSIYSLKFEHEKEKLTNMRYLNEINMIQVNAFDILLPQEENVILTEVDISKNAKNIDNIVREFNQYKQYRHLLN